MLAIEDANPAPILAIEDGDPNGADGQASLAAPDESFDPYLGAWSSDEDGEDDGDDVTPSVPPPTQQVSVETRSVENLPTDSLMASSSPSPSSTVPAEDTAARLARDDLLDTLPYEPEFAGASDGGKANCNSPMPASEPVMKGSATMPVAQVRGHGSCFKDENPNILEWSDFDSQFWVRPGKPCPEVPEQVSASIPLAETPSVEACPPNTSTSPGDDIKGNLTKPDLLADPVHRQART
eukprot:s826_g12.t1